MKKISLMCLMSLLCLLLAACGKTEAVKNIEAQIAAIEEVTLESSDALSAIEEAYASLTEEEKKAVGNYETFLGHRDTFDELRLTGTWYPLSLNLREPDWLFSTDYSLTLNADMTCTHQTREQGPLTGEWQVKNGELLISGFGCILNTNGGQSFPDGRISLAYSLGGEKDALTVQEQFSLVREADYNAVLGDVVRVIDCAEEPVNEYFSFTTHEILGYDEWGARSGHDIHFVCLKNDLFDEGWYYIGADEDFAMEIVYPGYTRVCTASNGDTSTFEMEAGSYTVTFNPFVSHYELQTRLTYSGDVYEDSFDLNDLAIGRAKGKMYFLNGEYITEMMKHENSRWLRIEEIQEKDGLYFSFTGNTSTGEWYENNHDY